MATGIYSTIKPATVNISDVEIFYSFTPNRETKPSGLAPIDASQVLEAVTNPSNSKEVVGGMYTLKLPTTEFNRLGYYTIYVRPKQIRTTVKDCGILSALPDIKGLVLESSDFSDKGDKGALMGYRIEYIASDGTLMNNKFTIVTYSNKCEAVSQNIGNSTQKSTTYRFNDTGNLLFLTVTPSTSPSVRANQNPFIGVAGQEIILTNPYFDPVVLEVELTEYDLESIAIGIYGEETRSIEDGVVSWYKTVNGERRIFKQSVLGEIKDEFGEKTLYEFKENLTNIDQSKAWDNTVGDAL